jgi:hypothetical protein
VPAARAGIPIRSIDYRRRDSLNASAAVNGSRGDSSESTPRRHQLSCYRARLLRASNEPPSFDLVPFRSTRTSSVESRASITDVRFGERARLSPWPGVVDLWMILLAGNRTSSGVRRLELERHLERRLMAVADGGVFLHCSHSIVLVLRDRTRSLHDSPWHASGCPPAIHISGTRTPPPG